MKKILIGLFLLNTLAYAQNGLDSIIVETYYISDANDTTVNDDGGVLPVGSVTYRIYVDLKPGYKFQALYGVPSHTMTMSTTTSFFNNIERGATTPNSITKTHAKNNTVMLDSWLSVGAGCSGNFGILKTEDDSVATVVNNDGVLTNSVSAMGIPLTFQDGLIAGSPQAVTFVGLSTELDVFGDGTTVGNLFTSDNGSVASLTGSTGPDTSLNQVLIAQITTDGQFCYELNIQIGTPTGGVENYVAQNPVGAEIQHPSLMGCIGGGTIPNILPAISITSPMSGATFITGANVQIDAMASDADGTVDSVEFYVNTTKIGSDLTAPYQINWLSSTGTYSLTAIATDNSGGQNTSAIVTVTVNSGVNIDDISEQIDIIQIYPNPVKDVFYLAITAGKEGAASYTMYSIQGGVLYHTLHRDFTSGLGKHIETIDMSSYAKGQYIIAVTIDGVTSTKKLIKN